TCLSRASRCTRGTQISRKVNLATVPLDSEAYFYALSLRFTRNMWSHAKTNVCIRSVSFNYCFASTLALERTRGDGPLLTEWRLRCQVDAVAIVCISQLAIDWFGARFYWP